MLKYDSQANWGEQIKPAFGGLYLLGGEGGIRTLEGFNTLPAFQASALDQLCDLSMYKMACNLHSILDFQKHSVTNIVILRSLFVNWQK